MAKKRELLVIVLAVMCFCGVALCGGKADGKEDPFKDTSVLVEAFVVRVSTEGLVKAGVNPIGNAPEGISILNILWCLRNPALAQVRSGVKAMASHNNESTTSKSETVYVKSTHGSKAVSNVRYNPYNTGSVFKVQPRVNSMGNVRVYAEYSNTDFVENEDSAGPSATISFAWKGVITAKSGVPVIASAVQSDEESITFLILTATIQDQQESKKK
jgi:hypothetical protein